MFDQVMARIASRFRRVTPRATARAYLLGLLSNVERKNCWQLAEQAGHGRPGPMQRLLRYARWDADAVPDDIRAYAAEHLGADGAVLVVDETGFVKKGHTSAGVQRQYTGTAGRIENAQVGVFLALATSRGRALIDRRLYLPEHSWCSDPERRLAAGIPEGIQFATKPQLAGEMITGALDAGITASWVTGDEAYGQDPRLRAALEARGVGYVMAVACSMRVMINHGRTAVRADIIAGRLPPPTAWQRHSAGNGAKGPRYYDWAWIHTGTGGHRHLLIRRNRTTGELAFYLCWSPTEISLSELVRVAGIRWSVEECFQAAKGQVGLDHYQVRHWTSWHRHNHARHARPGLPDRSRRRRGTAAARRSAPPRPQHRPDRVDRPGDPPPLRRPPQPTNRDRGQAAALVQLAQTPPGNSPTQPLPTTDRQRVGSLTAAQSTEWPSSSRPSRPPTTAGGP